MPTDHPARPRRRARAVLVMLFALAIGTAWAGPAAPAGAAGWSAPGFVRSVGAHGQPGLYAWGAAFNPVSGEVVIGDYLNGFVRRFTLDGRLLASFWVPAALSTGHPESVAVDPRDGAIYASMSNNGLPTGQIAKFDRTGAFLYLVPTVAPYHAWITVDDQGLLYLADSHFGTDNPITPPKVRIIRTDDAARTGTEIAAFGTWGTGPGQWRWITGLDVDAQHHLYAADTILRTVHVFDVSDPAHPLWLRDIGKSGASGQYTGDLRGVVHNDATDVLYVVDANGGQIERFTAATGVHLGSFGGGLGAGPGQFADGGRQLTLAANGDVYVADYGNFRFARYGADGTYLASYPSPAQPARVGGLAQPRDVAVDRVTGSIWVAETDNHRFSEFSSTGNPVGAWGSRGGSAPLGFNYPRGIGVEPVSGDIWVVDSSGDQIRIFAQSSGGPLYQRTLGVQPRSFDPGHFLKPMDVEFAAGRAYVSAYAGAAVKIIDVATGAEIGQIARNNNAVAIDPASGEVLLLSWTQDKVFRYSATGTFLGSWGTSGSAAGQLTNPWDIDVVDGTVYISDATLNRISAFTPTGTFLGFFGVKGSAAGQFSRPSGIDHDSTGNLYVADTGNDRIQVFATRSAAGAAGTPPTSTLTTPASGGVLALSSSTLAGTASDDVGVGTVEVAIQDSSTKLWWNASVATWAGARVYNLAGVTGADLRSAGWYLPVAAFAPGGSFSALVRARDATGQLQAGTPTAVPFQVSAT